MGSKIERAWQYGRDLTALAKTDILLTSYPKSGNTWVKFLLYNYFQHYYHGQTNPDFLKVNQTFPEIGLNQVRKWQPPFPGVPRIIKTHLKNNLFTQKAHAIHIVRNPYDVMVSYWYYLQASKKVKYSKSLHQFIRDSHYGIYPWLDYTRSWIKRHCLILFYEDIQLDPVTSLDTILQYISLESKPESLNYAVSKSTIKALTEMENEKKEQHANNLDSSYNFVKDGKRKKWSDLATSADYQYMQEALRSQMYQDCYNIVKAKYKWE